MNYLAEITTASAGSGTNEDPFQPFMDDPVLSIVDRTGVPVPDFPPDPEGYNIHVVATEEQMVTILGNNDYFVHWSEPIEEDPFVFDSIVNEARRFKQEGLLTYKETAENLKAMFPLEVAKAKDPDAIYHIEAVILIDDDKVDRLLSLLDGDVAAMINSADDDVYLIEFDADQKLIDKVIKLSEYYSEKSRILKDPPGQQSAGKPRDEDVHPNEWGKLRSWLARNKWSQAEINEAIGGSPAGRKNSEVCDELRNYIKERYGVSVP